MDSAGKARRAKHKIFIIRKMNHLSSFEKRQLLVLGIKKQLAVSSFPWFGSR
jgi:hypothetical protein